jgi:hypothetical protein
MVRNMGNWRWTTSGICLLKMHRMMIVAESTSRATDGATTRSPSGSLSYFSICGNGLLPPYKIPGNSEQEAERQGMGNHLRMHCKFRNSCRVHLVIFNRQLPECLEEVHVLGTPSRILSDRGKQLVAASKQFEVPVITGEQHFKGLAELIMRILRIHKNVCTLSQETAKIVNIPRQ